MRLEESEWAKWISGAEETGNANGSGKNVLGRSEETV